MDAKDMPVNVPLNIANLPDSDTDMYKRDEQELLQARRFAIAKRDEEISKRQPLRFGLPPGSAMPAAAANDRPPQYEQQQPPPEHKQPSEAKQETETDAEKAVRRFCKNLIGALSNTNKTKDKENQLVEIDWVETKERRQTEDGKTVPVWKKTYPRVPDAKSFDDNLDKLFKPAGYHMINSALTFIQQTFPHHYKLITPFDHISKHMDVFTTLCATLNRINIRVTHGVNDGTLVVQQSGRTLQGCMSYYRTVFRAMK
jgi:hypothetical protein